MPIFTLIARLTGRFRERVFVNLLIDHLLLVESMDSETNPRQFDPYRKKAKRFSPIFFQYIVDLISSQGSFKV